MVFAILFLLVSENPASCDKKIEIMFAALCFYLYELRK